MFDTAIRYIRTYNEFFLVVVVFSCGAILIFILNLRAFHRISCGFTHRFHVYVHLHGHSIVSIMIAAIASFHKLIFVAILLQLNHVNGSTDAAGTRLLLVNIPISSLIPQFFSPHFVL